MNTPADVTAWPLASRLRRLLAVYIDFLIFGPVWGLMVWAVLKVIPALEAVHPVSKFVGFLVLEAMLLRGLKWSPGHEILGIRLRLGGEYLKSRQESLLDGTLLVDPKLLRVEAWWTMLFGVVAMLNGAKTFVRWTMFTPPAPVFGIQLSDTASSLFYMTSGALECMVGVAALQTSGYLLPLSAFYYGLSSLSAFMSRDLWPQWIEAYTHARRAYQGVPVREGEVEHMQGLAPYLPIIPLVLLLWGVIVFSRFRFKRRAA